MLTNLEKYNFISAKQIQAEDLEQLNELLNNHFETGSDSRQIQIDDDNINWINNDLPECLNIIFYEKKIIGATFILPSTQQLMENFISGKITEAEMGINLKKLNINYDNMEAIYICFAFVIPEFQRKGLAFMSIVNSVKSILKGNKKLDFFFWEYSEIGRKLAIKVASNFHSAYFYQTFK